MAPCLRFILVLILAVGMARPVFAQEDSLYDEDFDIPPVEEQPFEFWGQAEFRAYARLLNKDSAPYKQLYYDSPKNDFQTDTLLRFKPEVSYKYEEFGLYARPRFDLAWSELPLREGVEPDEPSKVFFEDDDHWAGEVMLEEAFASWRPEPWFTTEVGKKVLKWGKGYAWNVVSFASRPKNVDDPDQTREGYVLAYADAIFSYQGPLKTFAVTPVVVPVLDRVNAGLASGDSLLYGGKLYFLLYDIDIDVMAMAGENYDTGLGMDFATNITDNFAIHGEMAVRLGYEKNLISKEGVVSQERYDAFSFLVGMRYLTETDTTFLIEYYHNGEGYTGSELSSYYDYVHDAYDLYMDTGNAAALNNSKKVSSYYNKSSVGQDYLYFRVTQKEPFDILYLTATMTVIANLDDKSLSLNPELSYMLTSNLELRPRAIIPVGSDDTEFGNKLNSARAELRFVYYF